MGRLVWCIFAMGAERSFSVFGVEEMGRKEFISEQLVAESSERATAEWVYAVEGANGGRFRVEERESEAAHLSRVNHKFNHPLEGSNDTLCFFRGGGSVKVAARLQPAFHEVVFGISEVAEDQLSPRPALIQRRVYKQTGGSERGGASAECLGEAEDDGVCSEWRD
jgi:hypothetical protein